jgi:hypothetical protein
VGTAAITVTDTSVVPGLTASAMLAQLAIVKPIVTGPVVTGQPPSVKVLGRPTKRGRDRTPTFRFTADDPATTFRCKLDDRPYRACDSPLTLPRLAVGANLLRIDAVDPAGQVGPVASYAFVITPRRHSKH